MSEGVKDPINCFWEEAAGSTALTHAKWLGNTCQQCTLVLTGSGTNKTPLARMLTQGHS